ncbi:MULTISPECIES: NO-inducible flavohemoprotein [Sphingosinicellaceae]|uniref:NO-inducible flavohemoprotein n=1 Tax=Sphingosinicellaceae TaxID=2820280 RepID=UPI001C1E1236|nr:MULTISPECIES: NO-inducible flavohemoprotein [Polymorphobacter]QYE33419.1 NO-inducible flavohemoprotein [Polymorphobacter sp. PAMC 29334]UAJ12522.1 NO-inducible flavohemoprotein [Polymorphobacter megasporae]
MIDAETRAIVRASAPAMDLHGLAVVERMYELLFRDPAIEAVFDPTHMRDGTQPRALAEAVAGFAHNIDNIGALTPLIERVAHKHVALGIEPEHYGAVGACLIEAMVDVLDDKATSLLLSAWSAAFAMLADIFIGRERALSAKIVGASGGWTGLRSFLIYRTEHESNLIRSLYLIPEDGGPVLSHRPGQYLTLRLPVSPERPLYRHYSLSNAPSSLEYRISVKREPRGMGSQFLHHLQPGTPVKCAAPAGHFVLDSAPERPVVLLSGGVGQTPLVSMLHELAAKERAAVAYMHAAINGSVHAFNSETIRLADRAPWISRQTFYENPGANDRIGVDYDFAGRIGDEQLAEACADKNTDVYLCGPTGFMRAMLGSLARIGVASDRVRFEFFGPQSSIEDARDAPR